MAIQQEIASYLDTTSTGVDVLSAEIPIPPGPFMTESVVFVEPKIPYHTNDEANRNGFETEQRVGLVIARLPYVASVRQVERNGVEDGQMIDLEVAMINEFIIPAVYVQVKNSKWGVADFFDEVGKKMREESKNKGIELVPFSGDAEYQRKKTWMAERRLIVINGGIRDGKPVTDEYIADKFDREVKALAISEKEK